MNTFCKLMVAGLLGSAAACAAHATTPVATDFSGRAVVTANTTDAGLLVNVLGVTPFSFSLSGAGSVASVASLFTLWTPEADVGADDKVAKAITVSFDLSPVVTGSATGTTVGQTSGLFGAVQNGRLTWSKPEFQLAFGDGGLLGVALNGGIFNTGLFGLGHLPGEGLKVGATFRLINPGRVAPQPGNAAVAAAPEPATWATMLVGFGAIGYGLRRRAPRRVAYSG